MECNIVLNMLKCIVIWRVGRKRMGVNTRRKSRSCFYRSMPPNKCKSDVRIRKLLWDGNLFRERSWMDAKPTEWS